MTRAVLRYVPQTIRHAPDLEPTREAFCAADGCKETSGPCDEEAVQQMPDRELVRQPGPLELTDARAVQPYPGARLDTVETEDRTAFGQGGPALRQVEHPQVVTGRVRGRHPRRGHRERIQVVRVDRRPEGPVALEDPVAGDRHLRPVPGVVPLRGERVVLGVRGRRQGGESRVPDAAPDPYRTGRRVHLDHRRQRGQRQQHALAARLGDLVERVPAAEDPHRPAARDRTPSIECGRRSSLAV